MYKAIQSLLQRAQSVSAYTAQGGTAFLCHRASHVIISCDDVCLLDAEDGKKAAKKAEDSRELAIQARDASRTLQSLSTEVPI